MNPWTMTAKILKWTGIVSGVPPYKWDPETLGDLPHAYSVEDYRAIRDDWSALEEDWNYGLRDIL